MTFENNINHVILFAFRMRTNSNTTSGYLQSILIGNINGLNMLEIRYRIDGNYQIQSTYLDNYFRKGS